MTLGRLLLAWVPVTLWFAAAAWLTERWSGDARLPRRLARVSAEGLAATLLASLWFDSLGHGGWWLVFLLLGVLVALPARAREVEAAAGPGRRAVLLGLFDVARYVAAGGILAWRLA